MSSGPVVLRMDDVGASSKRYEVYSSFRVGLGLLGVPTDWLFIKYLPGLKAWGPYRELNAKDWEILTRLLEQYGTKLTVGVTATWVEDEHRFIPYPEQFPEAAQALKQACDDGLVEIANHGLTHCVAKGNAFKPRWFSSNRSYHREFVTQIDQETQKEHLYRAQQILQDFFVTDVVTFIPPGNQFSLSTLELAQGAGLKYLSFGAGYSGDTVVPISWARTMLSGMGERVPADGGALSLDILNILLSQALSAGCPNVVSFHDREVVLNGLGWLQKLTERHQSQNVQLAREAVLHSSLLMPAEE